VDVVGRKKPFMGGAFAMGSFMLIIAFIVLKFPPKADADGITPAGAAGIAMVYLEAISFNMSWGPLPWLCEFLALKVFQFLFCNAGKETDNGCGRCLDIGEIFPSRIREIGVAVGAGSQWLFNFMMSQITPYAIDNIGWRTFLMFAIFNYAIIVYSYFVLRETAGKSLEEMEVVFGNVERLPDVKDVADEPRGNVGEAVGGGEGDGPGEVYVHPAGKTDDRV
jgi:hypothetical protein